MSFLIEQLWCCLHPAERGVLVFLETQFALLQGYVREDVYQAAWALTGARSALGRAEAVANVYGLQRGVITVGEGQVIEVRFFIGQFWVELALYIEDNGIECPERCVYLRYSDVN